MDVSTRHFTLLKCSTQLFSLQALKDSLLVSMAQDDSHNHTNLCSIVFLGALHFAGLSCNSYDDSNSNCSFVHVDMNLKDGSATLHHGLNILLICCMGNCSFSLRFDPSACTAPQMIHNVRNANDTAYFMLKTLFEVKDACIFPLLLRSKGYHTQSRLSAIECHWDNAPACHSFTFSGNISSTSVRSCQGYSNEDRIIYRTCEIILSPMISSRIITPENIDVYENSIATKSTNMKDTDSRYLVRWRATTSLYSDSRAGRWRINKSQNQTVTSIFERSAGCRISASIISEAQTLCHSRGFRTGAVLLTTQNVSTTAPRSSFGIQGGIDCASAWGIFRVVSNEMRGEISCGIDADFTSANTPSGLVQADSKSGTSIRSGAVHVGSFQKMKCFHRSDQHLLRDCVTFKGNILITGGLGAICNILVTWITTLLISTDRATPCIMVSGRRGRANHLYRWTSHACLVIARMCDVATSEDNLLTSISACVNGQIGIVMHTSGALQDASILNQTPCAITKTSAPKIAGLKCTHKFLLATCPVHQCVIFSSIASSFGSPGQANYVAANAWMDGWADSARRISIGGVVTSIQWGPWTNLPNGGMACSIQQSKLMKQRSFIGVGSLSPKDGVLIIEMLLKSMTYYGTIPTVMLASKFSWKTLLDNAGKDVRLTTLYLLVASPFPRRKRIQNRESRYARALTPSNIETKPCFSLVPFQEPATRSIILATIARFLGYEVDPDRPLIDAGVDSLSMTELGRQIETDVQVPLPSTALFDYPTVADLSAYVTNLIGSNQTSPRPLVSSHHHQATFSTHTHKCSERVGVVGTGMRFAGAGPDGCDSFEKFWQLLASGGDSVTIVPLSRWDIDVDTTCFGVRRRRDPEIEEYSRHGSFIVGIDSFDCKLFGIDSNEAALIDTQQRMLLKVVADAMHGGYLTGKGGRGSNTAVFVGICNNDRDVILREHVVELAMNGGSYNDIVDTVGVIAYSTYAFASNRISYILGLIGASISIDCASASALVAVHMAANEARRDLNIHLRCLAASVNLILHNNLTDLHTARKMFANDGRCKTFDANADGFERGEGVGATLLRNAAEMCDENSLVYIAGSVSIHKGGGASLRALRGPAIQLKVHRALEAANMEPNDVKYIEASGLGEPYGDAVEVSAYQNVFEPERISNDKLLFGSVHTNLGHLDGCSGIASFLKACAVTFNAGAPPLVHFKTLHALMRGKSCTEAAALFGHTLKCTDVSCFPSAFPMSLMPAYSHIIDETKHQSAGITCADCLPKLTSTVSSFGFGGTMANVIVEVGYACTRYYDTHRQVVCEERVIPRIDHRNRCDLQTLAEESLAYIESVVWKSIREVIGPSRKLARHALLLQMSDGTSLNEAEYRLFKALLIERLGVKSLPSSAFSTCTTVAHISHEILIFALRAQLSETGGISVGSIIKAWLKTHARRQCTDPCRIPLSLTLIPSRESLHQIAFVLANPRSGSTLTQLILNANPQLFAPQELYLLHFHTMNERRLRLSGQDLEGWIFEGLRKAVMELRCCDSRAASATLTAFDILETQQVYHILQGWADARILVDKTPPYIWSADTLHRAESLFHDARYIFICRHPYANIFSMTKETIRRDWLGVALDGLVCNKSHHLDSYSKLQEQKLALQSNVERALWEEAENLWALGNENVLDFFTAVSSKKQLTLCYETIVYHPETSSRAMCSMLGISFSPDMLFPFTDKNTSTFLPSFKGGLSAGDPHMLSRRGIHSHFANAWQRAAYPQLLTPFAAHVTKELGYRLPAWKHMTLHSEIPVDVVRLNSSTKEPAMVFIHDHTGDIHFLRSVTKKMATAAFCIRAVGRGKSNINESKEGQSQHQSSSFLCDCDVQSLAARYRSIMSTALEFSRGDKIIYGGIGSFGTRIAFEMAAQQQDAAIYDNNTNGVSTNSWVKEAIHANDGEHSAIGLLLFTNPGAFEVNDKLPLDVQAIHSAKLLLDLQPMASLNETEFNSKLLGLPITCLDAFRQEFAIQGNVQDHRLGILHSVKRSLHVTHRAWQLAELYSSPNRRFEFPTLVICYQATISSVLAEFHGTKDELLEMQSSRAESGITSIMHEFVSQVSS